MSEAIEHEILHSIYFREPNGYDMEITCEIRPLGAGDTRDAELVRTIEDFWRCKGEFVGSALR